MQKVLMWVWIKIGLILGFDHVDIYSPGEFVVGVTFSTDPDYLAAVRRIEMEKGEV